MMIAWAICLLEEFIVLWVNVDDSHLVSNRRLFMFVGFVKCSMFLSAV